MQMLWVALVAVAMLDSLSMKMANRVMVSKLNIVYMHTYFCKNSNSVLSHLNCLELDRVSLYHPCSHSLNTHTILHAQHYVCIVSDIDECVDISLCHQICNNTVGSFVCDCRPEFQLASDGRTCEGIKHVIKVNVEQ